MVKETMDKKYNESWVVIIGEGFGFEVRVADAPRLSLLVAVAVAYAHPARRIRCLR